MANKAGADDGAAIRALDARTLRERIADGALGPVQVIDAYLDRIAEREADLKAWAHVDADYARQQAAALDRYRATGRALGPLHGVPVGIKDVIDVAGMATENGTPAHRGNRPRYDAFAVAQLRQAGAIVLGKTATAELAFMHPAETRNPHDLERTPGGSSSGSAAAVADAMVPLALGTQTGGSIVRPAAFCGVTGFKPTFGAIPRRGVLRQAASLDTVGVFARTPGDAALLADALFGFDAADPDSTPQPAPGLAAAVAAGPAIAPRFALVQPPGWDRAEPQVHAAFAELADALADQAGWAPLPPAFDAAVDAARTIQMAELTQSYAPIAKQHADVLSRELHEAMATGRAIAATDYLAALDLRDGLYGALERLFEHGDAIVCPAALGPAPAGLATTGDPIFNAPWTYLGMPAVTVPLLTSEEGLPMGVQVIGRRGQDARLLAVAQWLVDWAEG